MANSTTQYVGSEGRSSLDVTENKTLDLAGSGIVQNVTTDAITVTLPATTAGAFFVIRNGGAAITSGGPAGATSDASVLVTVAPNASDKIQGNSFTAADNKAALNTKATAKIGDEIRIVGDGTDGWLMSYVKGTWARQA